MDRVTMANTAEPGLNLPNEVIDLTGDSPVVNSTQLRRARARNNSSRPLETNNSFLSRFQALENSIITLAPYPRHNPETFPEHDNSYIQIIDTAEDQLVVPRFVDQEELRHSNGDKSIKEYSTTVPCLNDSCSGEQVVLSCPICFEPLVAERKPMATICGHIFCATCLKQTLQGSRNKSCPKCNAPVKIKSCIRLYF